MKNVTKLIAAACAGLLPVQATIALDLGGIVKAPGQMLEQVSKGFTRDNAPEEQTKGESEPARPQTKTTATKKSSVQNSSNAQQVTKPATAQREACLSGVCVGDRLEVLAGVEWLSADTLIAYSQGGKKITSTYPKLATLLSKRGKRFMDKRGAEKIDMKTGVSGLNANVQPILQQYLSAQLIDNQAVDWLTQVTLCRAFSFEGVKQSKSGYHDIVTLAPVGTELQVVAIERDYSALDKTQWSQMIKALKKKYPSLLEYREAQRKLQQRYAKKGGGALIYTDPYQVLTMHDPGDEPMRMPNLWKAQYYLDKVSPAFAEQQACVTTTSVSID